MSKNIIFTVDGGGTKCRGSLYIDGERVSRGLGGNANASWGVDITSTSILNAWKDAAHNAGINPETSIAQADLVAGLAGIESPKVRQALLLKLDLFKSCEVITDGYAALLGASMGKPCTLGIVGTGMAFHRLFEDGNSVAIGGWGLFANDQGSAGWIGLVVVREWLRWRDGLHSPMMQSTLKDILAKRIGTNRADIFSWLTSALSGDYGGLALDVNEAAQNNDPYAQSIIHQAIDHIATYIRAIRFDMSENVTSIESKQCDSFFLAGGLAAVMQPHLKTRHNITTQHPVSDATHGCYLLATQQAPGESMREFAPNKKHDTQFSHLA